MKLQPSDATVEEKVVALPGIQPVSFINIEAADALQEVVNALRSGKLIGVAYSAIFPDGASTHDWNVPNGMGNTIFTGVSRLQHALLVSGTKWQV